MIRFFRWLLTGDAHIHKWKTLKTHVLRERGLVAGYDYYSKCEICGKHLKETKV